MNVHIHNCLFFCSTGDKHRSKSDRAIQRATLRLVLTTLEDGEEPSETIRLDDTKVSLFSSVFSFLSTRFECK
jgi:hypothetical protein